MRAEAAPWLPFTARKALVTATEILAGSKPTTAPLRRITLKSANRLCAEGLDSGSPTPNAAVAVALS